MLYHGGHGDRTEVTDPALQEIRSNGLVETVRSVCVRVFRVRAFSYDEDSPTFSLAKRATPTVAPSDVFAAVSTFATVSFGSRIDG